MISLTVVVLTLAVVLGGIALILLFRKRGFYEEEIRKKHPPGYRSSKTPQSPQKERTDSREVGPSPPT